MVTFVRRPLSQVADALAMLAGRLFYLWFLGEARLIGPDRAFESVAQAVSLVPDRGGRAIRGSFYARTLARCSPSCQIGFGTCFTKRGAEVGDYVYIGPNCDIGFAVIENDVLIGTGVHITSGRNQHLTADVTRPIRLQDGVFTCVRIGEGSWLGAGSVVMADVGRHAVVAAGAVVTHAVDDFAVVAGNPAVLVRRRTESAGAPDDQSGTATKPTS